MEQRLSLLILHLIDQIQKLQHKLTTVYLLKLSMFQHYILQCTLTQAYLTKKGSNSQVHNWIKNVLQKSFLINKVLERI